MKDYGMSKFQAEAVKARLDAAAKQMRGDMDDLNALADQLCAEGQEMAAGTVRQMAGHLAIVHGLGRTLKMQIDGQEVAPMSGGK